MNAKPIIFNGPMIRAILDGRKTQTRRIAKLTHGGHVKEPNGHRRWHPQHEHAVKACPYGHPAELLWVRENFAIECNQHYQDVYTQPKTPLGPIRWHSNSCDETQWFECPRYQASEPETILVTPDDESSDAMRWRPSIHIPRWASRLTLRITDVRVQRVQEISEEDARAEGVEPEPIPAHDPSCMGDCRWCPVPEPSWGEGFRLLWDSINAKRGYGWDANPWVWALSFDVIHANVDDVLSQRVAA